LSYEFFVFQHIVSSIAYLVFVFLHTRDLFTSWFYLWATVGIYGASIVVRMLATVWWNIGTSNALVSELADKAVCVQVAVPTTKGRWRPGQHIFLRFLTISPLQSHPFTIASIEEDGGVALIIKQRSGLTKALYNKVSQLEKPLSTRVLIDGPYGGPTRDPGAFDTVVLVAGGAGVTFTIPILKDLVQRMELDRLRCSKIIFVWTVRSEMALEWLREEIGKCALEAGDRLDVEYYVTETKVETNEKEWFASNISINYRRPKLEKILATAVKDNAGRMCVLAAGPEPLLTRLATEVAGLQKSILAGNGKGEIFLQIEGFGL
jgi:NAD(P)H-flavin reductase